MQENLCNISEFICGAILGFLIQYFSRQVHIFLELALDWVNILNSTAFDFIAHMFWGREFDEQEFCTRRNALIKFVEWLRKTEDIKGATISSVEIPCEMNKDLQLKLYFVSPNQLQNQKKPVLVYIHPGGYVMGNFKWFKHTCELLSQAGFFVVYVEYFLCPEYKHPYQVNNMKQALEYITSHKDEYNIDINNIVLFGQSAGATFLSPAVMMHRNLHMPGTIKGVIILYGVVPGGTNFSSFMKYRSGFGTNFHQVVILNSILYNKTEELYEMYKDYYALTTDFHDYPPFYIVASEHDPLRDTVLNFVKNMKSQNVPVQIRIAKDTVHGNLYYGTEGNKVLGELLDVAKQWTQ
ncbi:hypothetical protein WA158_007333 [Blastocystis sp. Blastoise]